MSNPARRLVLVGTSHDIQLANSQRDPGGIRFEAYLSELCKTAAIGAIAEEMSHEAMNQSKVTSSIPMRLAMAQELPHRLCDPDGAERRRLGMAEDENLLRVSGWFKNKNQQEIDAEVEAEYRKRERHWFEQLGDFNQWPVLFVCGANHFYAFAALLEGEGIAVQRAEADWGHIAPLGGYVP